MMHMGILMISDVLLFASPGPLFAQRSCVDLRGPLSLCLGVGVIAIVGIGSGVGESE